MPAWFAGLALAVALAGCGPAVSANLQRQAGLQRSFSELAAQPDTFKGRVVILGGEVMGVQPWGSGSIMAVDQRDLDRHFYPAGNASGGTFLVESDQWLSPGKYQPKSKVTVAGVVAGQRDRSPVLKVKEIHFWEGPTWEKWYYPVPREWYSPELEYWYTPPHFDPWRGGER
jgi:starvation-inducible outer membrane lipoprotein